MTQRARRMTISVIGPLGEAAAMLKLKPPTLRQPRPSRPDEETGATGRFNSLTAPS
jgi:hypothetical protein